jgi:hypothetical protein
MARRHVPVAVTALAHRRDEAAACCGVSVETFDAHVRPHVPAVRIGGVVVYPVAGLQEWLAAQGSVIADELSARRAA